MQQEISNLRHTTELYEAVKIDKKQLEIEIYQLRDQLHRVMEHNEKLIRLNGELDQRLLSAGLGTATAKLATPQLVPPAPPGALPAAPVAVPETTSQVIIVLRLL